MPELPEVETVRAGLDRFRLRAPVQKVWRSKLDLRTGAHWARAHEHVRRLRGCVPGAVSRRGKYLLWEFGPGAKASAAGQPWTMLVHLGMTGQCTVVRQDEARPKHCHLELAFEDGRAFRFVDARRFGGLRVDRASALHASKPLSGLGPEPFDCSFGAAALIATLGRSERALRDGLLDQRAVAGIGNIYASEICHRVGIDPRVACRRLQPAAWERVARATVEILRGAIARGGTTLRDYRQADGSSGSNQNSLRVYGLAGSDCVTCATEIQATSHQGRSLFWCPKCQSRPRSRWIA